MTVIRSGDPAPSARARSEPRTSWLVAGDDSTGTGDPRGGDARRCDFEESVRVGRGLLFGLVISLGGWVVIAALVTAGWLLLR